MYLKMLSPPIFISQQELQVPACLAGKSNWCDITRCSKAGGKPAVRLICRNNTTLQSVYL